MNIVIFMTFETTLLFPAYLKQDSLLKSTKMLATLPQHFYFKHI
jgi:hypothetical protein